MAIVHFRDYQVFKSQLDKALKTTANDMVMVGYLLKEARDTNILAESGYSGMGEFAKVEYGLSPDQTSRFISICEKYGNGEDRLLPQYEEFGYTKLSEMLTLPDAVAAAISPEITREEIRELKAEVKAEEEITPLEVMMEKPADDPEEHSELYNFFLEYFRPEEHAPEFLRAIAANWAQEWRPESGDEDRKAVLDGLAPSGIGILEARIPGKGRFMLSFKGEDVAPVYVDIRNSISREASWREIRDAIEEFNVTDDMIGEEGETAFRHMWEKLYDQEFPKSNAVLPIGRNETKTEKKAEKKVKIAPAQNPQSRKSTLSGGQSKNEKAETAGVSEDKSPESQKSTLRDENGMSENAVTARVDFSENPETRESTLRGEDAENAKSENVDFMPPPEDENSETRKSTLYGEDADLEKKLIMALGRAKAGLGPLREACTEVGLIQHDHNHWYIGDIREELQKAWEEVNSALVELMNLKIDEMNREEKYDE